MMPRPISQNILSDSAAMNRTGRGIPTHARHPTPARPVIYPKVQRFSRQSSSSSTEPRPPPHAPDRSSYPWDESETSAYLAGLRASPLFQRQVRYAHPALSGQSRGPKKRSNVSPSSTRLRGGIPHALAGGGNRAQHRVKNVLFP